MVKPPAFKSVEDAEAWMEKNRIAVDVWLTRGRIYVADNGDWILYSTGRLSSGKFGVAVFPGLGRARKYVRDDRPEWSYVREFRLRKDAKDKVLTLFAERSAKKPTS